MRSSASCDIFIIGAGPVGLLLAALLGRQGFRVVMIDRALALPEQSQAIGITPPSLEILSTLGLDTLFVRRGVPIEQCHVFGYTGYLGAACFRDIGGSFPFVLSLPQRMTMAALERQVASLPTVELRRGVEFQELARNDDQGVAVITTAGAWTAAFAVACDGCHSAVRHALKIPTKSRHYSCHFVMADFADHTALGRSAALFFGPEGAVESFPLPDGQRRWIVQTPERMSAPAPGFISELVRQRVGIELCPRHQLNYSVFSPWRLDCGGLCEGRVLLAGDAAHVMSPIGGQGMNTGFADAEFLAVLFDAVLRRGQAIAPWLSAYNDCRRQAGRAAARRAALGMWLGTWTGRAASLLRDFILRDLIFSGPLSSHVGPWFSMRSLPHSNFRQSRYLLRCLPA